MDQTEIILPILQRIPLFAELNDEQHHAIIQHIELQFFPAEYVLFNEGDEGNAMYIIKTGSVQILHPAEDVDDIEVIKELTVNDFFGEMALISSKPRNASAKTLEDTEVFVLKKTDFMKLLSSTPGMANKISREFIERLKENQRNEQ